MHIEKSGRSAGFSLVEIMVGLTIGLITVLVVSQVMQVAEARKRVSTSGADATVNATMALYTIERDGKNAGYGINTVKESTGCPIHAKYGGEDEIEFNLVPARIVNGSDTDANAPDSVQFLASNKNGVTLPTRIAVEHPRTAANFFVESDMGVQDGDLMIAVPTNLSATPPTWCSLFQVTGTGGASGGGNGSGNGGSGNGSDNGNGNGNAQGQNQVLHNSGQSDWNQPGGSTIFPEAGYAPGDYVINLGSFLDHTYSIRGNYLRLTDYSLKTNNRAEFDLYPNIVQLQAVYGKDTTTPPDHVVDAWNADAPTTPAEWQQVIAIRIALVARSQSPEPGIVTLDGSVAASTCDSANPHPAAVCWRPNPTGNGAKIDVSAGSANWQRYRYRVMETTIPLRNAIWQQ
ncbi:PilW family protein [Noviherbaspirillum cavernae]|uniref:PilW family protein n=1 Tax=Noviherbaspirillum cavernae TaxID=2320862 RepID=UPI00131430E2|nr:PilW family protein [Noviherbaspirillum cavernae]